MHISTDSSTATRVEKARRVLKNLAAPQSAYFFDDGYPRADKIANDTAAALEVFDEQVAEIERLRVALRFNAEAQRAAEGGPTGAQSSTDWRP